MDRDILQAARLAHYDRTGHLRITVGANWIECFECGRHAHLGPSNVDFFSTHIIEHNADYSIHQNVKATSF